MRLIVARCSVDYTGRLTAHLPEALRLIMVKADGSVLVHADAGGYKPLNWMTPPTVIEEATGGSSCASSRARTGSRSRSPRSSPTSRTRWTSTPTGSRRTASRRDLQVALADAPELLRRGLPARPARVADRHRAVDLMCRDDEDGWIAVEIKRVGTIDAVEQLAALSGADPARPGDGGLPRRARGAGRQAAGARARRGARDRLGRGRPRRAARRARAGAHAVRAERLLAVSVTISERAPPWSRCSHR